MRIPAIDDPIRLDGPFWTTLGLTEAAFCWYFRPWAWDYPLWHRIIAALLFPFLAAVAVYGITMFVVSLVHDFRSQRQRVAFLAFALVIAAVVIAYEWVAAGFGSLPDHVAVVASVVANSMYAYLNRRKSGAGVDGH